MSIDLNFLKEVYFTFDQPVPYQLKCGKEIKIYPVYLSDYMAFMTSYDILDIDKNSQNDVDVISMSYLKFLVERVLPYSSEAGQKLVNLCLLCLKLQWPQIGRDDKNRPLLCEVDKEVGDISFFITQKEFNDIKRIILYQNLPNYDDEYINPELKENMKELDNLKNKNLEIPSLERKMAIVTSHTGISKKEQLEMTIRAHSLLFQEIANEVEYNAAKPLSIYAGKSEEIQWIFKKKKDKFSDYITSVEDYNKSMGGSGNVKTVNNFNKDLISQYEKH